MVLFGSILMAIPQFWMASLPEDLSETDMQILLALPGLAWIVIGVGVLLLVIGLQKSIMMT
jgi:hypothetical protein